MSKVFLTLGFICKCIISQEILFGPITFNGDTIPSDLNYFNHNTSNNTLNCYQESECRIIGMNEYIEMKTPLSTLNYNNIKSN